MPPMHIATRSRVPSQKRSPQPAWEVATLFPYQGFWEEEDYCALVDFLEPHPILELCEGRVEVLPVPTQWHQFILQFFYECLKVHAQVKAPGVVLVSGMRIRIRKKKSGRPEYRGPDVMYMKKENSRRRHEKYWDGADLVAEIVSGSAEDRRRDYVAKRRDYAAAGIPEYWLIDPEKGLVRVLVLKGKAYRVHGDFKRGQIATSFLLPGFSVAVDALLDAGQ